jgi:hypothetical protein
VSFCCTARPVWSWRLPGRSWSSSPADLRSGGAAACAHSSTRAPLRSDQSAPSFTVRGRVDPEHRGCRRRAEGESPTGHRTGPARRQDVSVSAGAVKALVRRSCDGFQRRHRRRLLRTVAAPRPRASASAPLVAARVRACLDAHASMTACPGRLRGALGPRSGGPGASQDDRVRNTVVTVAATGTRPIAALQPVAAPAPIRGRLGFHRADRPCRR